ncbi:flagellar hook protein FlgE [Phenylobacterium sp. 20VBR1]|uniref:Flagellar hook protein FlgE n=1 Tax=Phenylobacterium glaciei TaxID=2803784 RepID=A0A941HXC5_9CAUL|nr:flagellar hook protein FlgE [Phenylobacterium glaciei]MBR7620748.1 flagellar hook protein FlgE [Phenylobacterium glaciei]
MSINSAMLAGVSGLVSNSSALAAISDNIANVNTTAYKRNQVNFANVVTAQAVKGRYSAGGVQAVTRQFVGQQGLITSASSPTDLGISGDGFFVVTQKATGLTAADNRSFTRSGSFSVDADGFMVNDAKLYLQGWKVKDDGTMDINPSDLTKLEPINVKNLGAAVRPTGNIVVNANVDKRLPTAQVDLTAYDPTAQATSMAGYADGQNTVYKPDFTIEMNIIDSVGGAHKVAMSFIHDPAVTNEFKAEIYTVPGSDIDTGTTSGLISSGTVRFTATGAFDKANSTVFGALNATPKIVIGDSAGGASPAWATALGITGQTINFDLDRLASRPDTSSVTQVNSDGASVGNVVGVEVDENGVVSAIFDNSEIRQVAKIALATFPNPDGLTPVSGNAYRPTIQSGEFVLKEPTVAGAGQIASSTLEASTVDLSAEFTGLISTQKAYSASSKIITTADQMLEELINIKR